MNKLIILPIILVSLSGCNRSVSSSLFSSSTTSIPIPNDDFNPLINGRTILKETLIQTTYHQVAGSELAPLPLSEINFPRIDGVVTDYAVEDAVEGNFLDQNIQFSGQNPTIPSQLSSLTHQQFIEDQAAFVVLQDLQVSDERFNQLQSTKKHRDLSHVYYGSDYYWFNQFVEQEQFTITRHTNHVLYGQWQKNKMFQTEVSINIDVAYQLYADASMIYEITDETYPNGFFGAQDQKFETIRTEDNLKIALTLGPVTTFLQQWYRFENNQTPLMFPFHGDIALANRSLSITKQGDSLYQFKLQVYLGSSFESAEESYQMTSTLRGHQWEQTEQHYQLWQPSPTNP
ncbi:MAG: hypothetical protein ACO22H_00725 [Bacilli bacterium]